MEDLIIVVRKSGKQFGSVHPSRSAYQLASVNAACPGRCRRTET